MQFLIISVFFGSGKTTLILELARELVIKRGKKVGIIVNDIGEVGIDDKVMKSYGLNVKEMFGGCICCEMAVNLPTTLKALKEVYNPDVVILEPSGIADASNVKKVLDSISNLKIDVLPVVALFDATQFDLLVESLPFIIAQLKSADKVLVNKIDRVSDSYYMKRLEEEIQKVNEDANVMQISALHKLNIDKVVENILRR
ncbi:MAG: cobalamin biosynthesis protein P47K [archaeon]|nr:cobalamin biosynthesis protein P47K [archaeon]